MTTAPTQTSSRSLDLSSTSAVPLTRLVKVELRKMVDTRSGLWLIIAIVFVTAAITVIFMFAADEQDRVFLNFIGVLATPQSFLLPVLGILLVTQEWSQRTGMVTFTLEPHRGKVITAKVFAALIYGLLAVVVAIVFSIWTAAQDIQPWVDPSTAQTPLFEGVDVTGEQWAQLAVTTAIWVLLPFLAGLWRVLRAELK